MFQGLQQGKKDATSPFVNRWPWYYVRLFDAVTRLWLLYEWYRDTVYVQKDANTVGLHV